jgi:hypothetical protein
MNEEMPAKHPLIAYGVECLGFPEDQVQAAFEEIVKTSGRGDPARVSDVALYASDLTELLLKNINGQGRLTESRTKGLSLRSSSDVAYLQKLISKCEIDCSP